MTLNGGYTYHLTVDLHEHGHRLVDVLAARHSHSPAPLWLTRLAAGEIDVDGATLEETVRLTTAACNAWLEGAVRAHPEQWLWIHRRWKPR